MRKICWLLVITLLLGCLAACQSTTGSDQTTGPLPIENEDGTLAQWMKDEIVQAYVNEGGSAKDILWADETPSGAGRRYYGTDNGYVILCGIGGPECRWTIEIGEYVFKYSCHFWLWAYKDGELFQLKDVYEQGLISDDAIQAAWERHCNFQK